MRLRDLLPARWFPVKSPGARLDRAGVLVLLLYVLAGVIYSAHLAPVARYPDEEEYLKLSHNLLQGPGYSMDGVHLTACRPPGYVFFISAIQLMGGDFFGIRVVQYLLLGGTIVLVCRICSEKKIFAGLPIVTGLVICYPVLFYTSATLYPQTFAGFLFILALVFTLVRPEGLGFNLAAGVTFGALILAVPTFLFTLAVVLGTAWFLKILRWRAVLLITLTASLIVASWTVRTAVIFHRFVPVASNSGLNFLIGNNGQTVPTEAAANVAMRPYYLQTEKLGLDEFQSDQFYKEVAVTWIKAHPGDAIVLYFEKVLNYFNIINVYSSQVKGEISTSKQIIMAVSYLLILGLLAWRLFEAKRFPLTSREKLFLIVYVLTAFTSAIFFTRIRLRLPYDYLIIAIIALHLSRRLEIWLAGAFPEAQPSAPQAGS
jgi:hypothetical protein